MAAIRERESQPVVLPMTLPDLDDIMAIERESFTAPWSRGVFREEMTRDWAYLRVLRPSAGAPAVAFVNFWLVRDEIHILNIAVHPKHRRHGHASHLLGYVCDFAVARSVRYITLEVRRSNHGAIQLYKSFDFRPIGIRPNYYVEDREDAVVMLRTLGEPPSE